MVEIDGGAGKPAGAAHETAGGDVETRQTTLIHRHRLFGLRHDCNLVCARLRFFFSTHLSFAVKSARLIIEDAKVRRVISMPRGAKQEKPLLADKRVLSDPADFEDIERLFKKTRREKEEALMLAVLADAIECFQKYVFAENEREKRSFQEAEDWILEKNSDWLFSFHSICETLELSPDYLRQGLVRWKEAKVEVIRKPSVDHHKVAPSRYTTTSTSESVKRRWARPRPLSAI